MSKNKQNQTKLLREDILDLIELPFEYLQYRAKHENMPWEMPIDFFVKNFQKGCRSFYGVNLNEMCFPVFDLQEPSKGFMNNFICWHISTYKKNN